jgi:hypothetical protein
MLALELLPEHFLAEAEQRQALTAEVHPVPHIFTDQACLTPCGQRTTSASCLSSTAEVQTELLYN